MRVSTEKQHIGNQREEIGRFAERHGLTVYRWVTETASGRTIASSGPQAGTSFSIQPVFPIPSIAYPFIKKHFFPV